MTKPMLVTAVLIATTAACSGRDPAIPSNAQDLAMLPAGTQQSYQNSGFTEPARLVIRDDQSWASAWATLMQPSPGAAGAPAIDFAADMVVLAAMGQKNHGGYQVAINDVAATTDVLYVSVTESSPGRSCVTAQALVEPVTLVRVARFDGDVQFIENTKTIDCF